MVLVPLAAALATGGILGTPSPAGAQTPAPPPPGTTTSNTTPLGSAPVTTGAPVDLSGQSADGTATVTVPAGALPVGSTVTELAVDLSDFRPPSGTHFLVGFGASWQAPDASRPPTSSPVTLTISDSAMAAGDVVYLIGPDDGLIEQVASTPADQVTVTFDSPSAFLVDAADASQEPTAPPGGGGTSAPAGSGYRLLGASGAVFDFGPASYHGGLTGVVSGTGGTRAVALASTPDGNGYWIATANGAVAAFGDARSLPSAAGHRLARPIVAMAATPDGGGYWLAGAGGAVFSFGDARFHGAMTGALGVPLVGMAATPDGGGYWLVAATGRVYCFGDAVFRFSAALFHPGRRIVGMAAAPDGDGYWEVGAGGAVFSFGDARYHGGPVGKRLTAPVVGMAATPGGAGYWLVTANGGILGFGDAPLHGSSTGSHLAAQVVGMAAG